MEKMFPTESGNSFPPKRGRSLLTTNQDEFLIREIKYGFWSTKELEGEFHDCVIAQK